MRESDWIDVGKTYPPENTKVRVRDIEGNEYEDSYNVGAWGSIFWGALTWPEDPGRITHWMPIVPSEKK